MILILWDNLPTSFKVRDREWGDNMRCLIGIVLLLSTIALAETPIPEALSNARTAVVLNDGATDKDFDRFCKALNEWGRFKIVQNKAMGADIIIELSLLRLPYARGPMYYEDNRIRIFNAQDNRLLWQDQTSSGHSKNPDILVSYLKRKMKER